MKCLNEEQIVRLYNVITNEEKIERATVVGNRIKITARSDKTGNLIEYAIDFKNDLKWLDFVINGIELKRGN